jgi:signal transduction histidine kinase
MLTWKKVITPTLLVCGLWLLLSGGTTYWIHFLSRSHGLILTEYVTSIRAAASMQNALWQLEAAFGDAIQSVPDAANQLSESEAEFDQALGEAEQAAIAADERALVAAIRDRFGTYREFIHQHAERSSPNRSTDEATAVRVAAGLARQVAIQCDQLVEYNETMMSDAATRLSHQETTLNSVRVAFLIAGPAIGIFTGMRIAMGLHESISQISVTLKDTSGRLDEEIGRVEISPSNDPDDLSRLNRQVQSISARIVQVLSELQTVRHEAVRSERLAAVGQLAAGVAHEIRNPLTSVKLLIQTAALRSSTVQLDERQVHVLLQEILRMEETIQELLDFARPPLLKKVLHDVRDTAQRALNLIQGRAMHHNIDVSAQICDAAMMVDGDPELLHQVFVNLLINGIESMAPGGRLDVSLGPNESTPDVCRICVADVGSGISAETLSRIFDPFLTTKERGTGLGLAISRGIIQQHQGRITATNRLPAGAMFVVELPLARVGTPAIRDTDFGTAEPFPVLNLPPQGAAASGDVHAQTALDR